MLCDVVNMSIVRDQADNSLQSPGTVGLVSQHWASQLIWSDQMPQPQCEKYLNELFPPCLSSGCPIVSWNSSPVSSLLAFPSQSPVCSAPSSPTWQVATSQLTCGNKIKRQPVDLILHQQYCFSYSAITGNWPTQSLIIGSGSFQIKYTKQLYI